MGDDIATAAAAVVFDPKEARRMLHAKNKITKRKRTAGSTKKGYLRIQKIFCEKFMKKYFPEVPNAHDVDLFTQNPAAAEHLQNKEFMEGQNIVLLFLQCLPDFCVKEEKDIGHSTFASARAAVRDLFKQAGCGWEDKCKFDEEITDWCRGNKRTIAEYRLSGKTKVTVGKRHMFFDLYVALAEEYFNRGLLFEWAFHVLTWNLMTR